MKRDEIGRLTEDVDTPTYTDGCTRYELTADAVTKEKEVEIQICASVSSVLCSLEACGRRFL